MKEIKSIPIVDLSSITKDGVNEDNPSWEEVAEKVRDGLGSIGFLYLTNHGIPDRVVSDAMNQGRQFFDLPQEVKESYPLDTVAFSKDASKMYGYSPQGGEKLHNDGRFEMKETFDWKPNGIEPTELPDFRKHLSVLDSECKKFMRKFLKLLALSLKLDDIDFFVKSCRHLKDEEIAGGLILRMLHYPPVEAKENESLKGVVRLAEHSDSGFLTFLFQDDAGGLEVKTVEGDWIHAKPIPGSIIVNAANLIEHWTCGIYPATKHRIVIPESEHDSRRTKDRYSIAFFTGPDKDTIISPMEFLKKRSSEEERLKKSGKVYNAAPIPGLEYWHKRIAKHYGQVKGEEFPYDDH